jgi:hypothetical protein
VGKKNVRGTRFLFAKKGQKREFRPWKFCGTSDRGTVRTQMSSEALRAALPFGSVSDLNARNPSPARCGFLVKEPQHAD